MKTLIYAATAASLTLSPLVASADEAPRSTRPYRVRVSLENLAPKMGTFLTPVWVGFHDGSFDTYDGNTPASNDPRPGSVAMERLCEDGNNAPISRDFADLSNGIDATLAGPSGPIAPGDVTSQSFLLDAADPNVRYFSYASMILPSNDFCISNGNPRAHLVFDAQRFVARDFFVAGNEVLDAGTEVNDELPANTAFFGQSTPNTGVDENGLIGTLGSDRPAIGFAPRGSGGVLDAPRFRMADFLARGYPVMKVGFTAAPAITQDLDFSATLRGRGYGHASLELRDEGTKIEFSLIYTRQRRVQTISLRLRNGGAVVANLVDDSSELSPLERRRLRFYRSGILTGEDLTGPYGGLPLDKLSAALRDGAVEIVVSTKGDVEALTGTVGPR